MALFKIFNNIDSRGDLPSTFTKGYMYFDAVTGVFYIDTAGEGGASGTRIAVNAKKAWEDGNGDRISTTYLKKADFTAPSGYCTTISNTAAKTASCTDYSALNNSYLHILIKNSNTAAEALTLNINEQGAKPIYINGEPSSNTNYTLPAGTYISYYDGTNYHFRTDGLLPGKIIEAAKVTHSLSFGNGTYVFDGSADVVVPSYDGTYTAS